MKHTLERTFLLRFLTLVTFTFGCLATSLNAQNPNILNGFYISPQGAKVTGTLNIIKWRDNILKFKPNGEKQWRKLNPAEVLEAGTEEGMSILSHRIISGSDTARLFIMKMVGGGYSLYEGKDKRNKAVFFIRPPNKNTLIYLRRLTLALQLQTLFKDCPGNMVVAPEYARTNLIRQVKALNLCTYPEQPVIVYDRKVAPKIALGVSAYYYNIKPISLGYHFAELGGNQYHSIQKLSGGVMAKIAFTPAIGVSFGINYIDKSMNTDSIVGQIYYLRTEPGKTPYYSTNYYKFKNAWTFQYLEIPLIFSYALRPYSRFSPTLSLGPTFLIPIKTQIHTDWGYPFRPPGTFGDIPSGEVGHITVSSLETKKVNTGFCAAIGLRRHLSKKGELECRLEYFYQKEKARVGIAKVGTLDWEINSSRLQFSINYCFPLGK